MNKQSTYLHNVVLEKENDERNKTDYFAPCEWVDVGTIFTSHLLIPRILHHEDTDFEFFLHKMNNNSSVEQIRENNFQ